MIWPSPVAAAGAGVGDDNNNKTKSKKDKKKAPVLPDVHNIQQSEPVCCTSPSRWLRPLWFLSVHFAFLRWDNQRYFFSWHVKCFISFLTCFKMKHTLPHTEARVKPYLPSSHSN